MVFFPQAKDILLKESLQGMSRKKGGEELLSF